MPTNERSPWSYRQKLNARGNDRFVLTYKGEDYTFNLPMPEGPAQLLCNHRNDLFRRTAVIDAMQKERRKCDQMNSFLNGDTQTDDLRDRFAMAVLPTAAAGLSHDAKQAAEFAYRFADAMLAERSCAPTGIKLTDEQRTALAAQSNLATREGANPL